MPYFAVDYRYTEDVAALDATRPAHRAYLTDLAGREALVASGPYVGVTPGRALLLFRADDEAAVRELVSADPFQRAGLVSDTRILEWNPVIGVLSGG